MDQAYLKQFAGDQLKQRLLQAANLAPLEQILSQEGAELGKLNQLKSELNLRQTLRSDEIKELFSRIQRDVNAFLQVSDIPSPSLASFSLFRLYAQAQGEQIYAHMLNGCFVFPDAPPV